MDGNHGSERYEDGGSGGRCVGGRDGEDGDSDDCDGGDDSDIYISDNGEKDHAGCKGDFDGDDEESLGFLGPQQSRINHSNTSSSQMQGMPQKRRWDLITNDEDRSYGIEQGCQEPGSTGYGEKATRKHHQAKRLMKKNRGTNKNGFERGVIDNIKGSQPQKRRCPICPKAITKAYTFKEFQQHKLLHSSNISCPSCAETFLSMRECEAHKCPAVSETAPKHVQDGLEKEPLEPQQQRQEPQQLQQLSKTDAKQQGAQELETGKDDDDYWTLNLALRRAQMQADRDAGNPMNKRKCRLCPPSEPRHYAIEAYRKHVRGKHERAFVCPQCGMGFCSPSLVLRHLEGCLLI